MEPVQVRHNPVIEKPSKTFSIKDIISESSQPSVKQEDNTLVKEPETALLSKEEFSPDGLASAWKEFTEQLKGEAHV